MTWTRNGIIVQSEKARSSALSKYRGIGVYDCWPLAELSDEKARAITEEAEDCWFGYMYNDNTYPLAVVPTMEYIDRYVVICNILGIDTRLIMVESERSVPRFENIEVTTELLGFDYVTSQEFFSVVEDDLFGQEIVEPSSKYNELVNDKGLFVNETDLESYIHDRNDAIAKGYNLESQGDYCRIRLSLVTKIEN